MDLGEENGRAMESDRRKFIIGGAAAVAGAFVLPGSASAAQNVLTAGGELRRGESLWSRSGQAQLVLQHDGNLVTYALGVPLWSTRTNGSDARRLVLQGDGNLVLYGADGPVWDTRTNGSDVDLLKIEDYGLIKLLGSGKVRWHNDARSTALMKGKSLHTGEMLVSNNLAYKLILQHDGNLVQYHRGNPVWHTRTNTDRLADRPTRLAHQTDGNLVLYTAGGDWIWQSRTSGKPTHRLQAQNDGNLVLRSPSDTAVWHRKNDTSLLAEGSSGSSSGTHGAAILASAKQFKNGDYGGQCKAFVGNRVREVTGVYPTGYQAGFEAAGARAVSSAEAAAGDIIQVTPKGSTDATAESLAFDAKGNYLGALHTAIIGTNKGSGNFTVVDSNWGGDELVDVGRVFNPSAWAPGAIVKYWRF